MKRVLFLLLLFCLIPFSCFSQKKALVEDKFLIVLDIQEYYTNNKLSGESAQKLIDSINYVMSNTSSNNVIYIKSIHKLLNLSLSWPFVYVTHDTSAMCLDKRLNLVNDNILTKEEPNTFTIKALNDFLKQNNAKEIIITGLLAEQGVYESLIAGKKLGYDMYIIPEAIVGKSQKSKEKVIKKLLKKGIKILDINTLNHD
jgi:nicotinamidase-related amidase